MPRRLKRWGRPTKVTPEILETVSNALLVLCKHETAANLAGIGLRTFYRWRRLGEEKPNGPFGEFSRAVRGAEAKAQQSLSAVVALGARSDPHLALEVLHARWPKLWPKVVKVEVEREVEAILLTIGKVLPPLQYARCVDAIAHPDGSEGTEDDENGGIRLP